jgi:hypothetical protein
MRKWIVSLLIMFLCCLIFSCGASLTARFLKNDPAPPDDDGDAALLAHSGETPETGSCRGL